jgi:AcrR family transcriptional regulator
MPGGAGAAGTPPEGAKMEASDVVAQEAPTARGRKRREQIIDAAASLFHRQGFHATSIDEIGTAAGITGPGLYRHFAGKDEILLGVFDRIWELLRSAIDRIEGLQPEEALDDLISTHTTLALDQGAALMLLVRELRYVPEYYQRAAERNDARYTDAWAEVIIKLHPRLTLDEARAAAHGVMGLIASAARDNADLRIDASRHRRILHEMACASLAAF